MKSIIRILAVACFAVSSASSYAQDQSVRNASNGIINADNFGRMTMIATLTALGPKALTEGTTETVNLPMTVALSERTSDGQSIKCIQICTVIGGVPVCVCI